MSKIYSARKTGKILGLPHLEVIRRIRRGDIDAKKMDWNWVITGEAIEKARQSDWYQRRLAKQKANATGSTQALRELLP